MPGFSLGVHISSPISWRPFLVVLTFKPRNLWFLNVCSDVKIPGKNLAVVDRAGGGLAAGTPRMVQPAQWLIRSWIDQLIKVAMYPYKYSVTMTPLCVARQRPGCGQSRSASRQQNQSRDQRDVTRASPFWIWRSEVPAISRVGQRRSESPPVLWRSNHLYRWAFYSTHQHLISLWKKWSSADEFLYYKTLFFHCILILQFSYVENSLHFNLADFYYQNSYRIIAKCYKEYGISHHRIVDILCRYIYGDGQFQKFACIFIAKIWCSRNIHVLQYRLATSLKPKMTGE